MSKYLYTLFTSFSLFFLFIFFFNDTATTEIYTLPYTTLFRSRRDLPTRLRHPDPAGAHQRGMVRPPRPGHRRLWAGPQSRRGRPFPPAGRGRRQRCGELVARIGAAVQGQGRRRTWPARWDLRGGSDAREGPRAPAGLPQAVGRPVTW